MSDFPSFLQSRLRQRGDLAKLSEASGIAGQVLKRWASGEMRPRPDGLRKLAPAVGLPYEELMKLCGYLPGAVEPVQMDPELAEFVHTWPSLDPMRRGIIRDLMRHNARRHSLAYSH